MIFCCDDSAYFNVNKTVLQPVLRPVGEILRFFSIGLKKVEKIAQKYIF